MLKSRNVLIFQGSGHVFNVRSLSNVIKSSKEGPGHGIGLSSIHETVNRYNGNVDYKYTENRFDITITMCNSLSCVG
ncbi:MAG: GHKL domain-containing protein [Ruminiclostridium sp.]